MKKYNIETVQGKFILIDYRASNPDVIEFMDSLSREQYESKRFVKKSDKQEIDLIEKILNVNLFRNPIGDKETAAENNKCLEWLLQDKKTIYSPLLIKIK